MVVARDDTGASQVQRTDEWLKLDAVHKAYHIAQWKNPYRSTEKFVEFSKPYLERSNVAVDIGCGAGAATFQFARSASQTKVIGVDINPELIAVAKEEAARFCLPNLSYEIDDWFNLKSSYDADLIFSVQTLSWLPDYRPALRALFERVGSKWIAISSLFYEGNISCRIEVEEHAQNRRAFYNTLALPQLDAFSRRFGYSLLRYQPFEIDIHLPMSSDRNRMGTYTVDYVDKRDSRPGRLQISGPLLMNWGFVVLERK